MKLLLLLSAMLSALTSVVGARAPQVPAVAQAAVAAKANSPAEVRRAARIAPELLTTPFPSSGTIASIPLVAASRALMPLYADRRRE